MLWMLSFILEENNNLFYLTLNVSFFHPSILHPRTNTLLEKVAAAVEQSAFYSALWGSLLTSPAVRLPGITYVLAHLNRKLSMEDQLYIIGSDIELMVGCHVTSVPLEPGIPDYSEDHAGQHSCSHGAYHFSSKKTNSQNTE